MSATEYYRECNIIYIYILPIFIDYLKWLDPEESAKSNWHLLSVTTESLDHEAWQKHSE